MFRDLAALYHTAIMVAQELAKRTATCQQQMAELKSQLDTIASRKADVVAQLDKAVDDAHPYRDALVAIFNKKIKRAGARGGLGSHGDEDSDEEDESDDDDDDDSDDESATPDVCPPGCDQALYDEARRVLALVHLQAVLRLQLTALT